MSATQPRLIHEALVYSSDEEFLERLVPFLQEGLAAGDPARVVLTPNKSALLRDALGARRAARLVQRREQDLPSSCGRICRVPPAPRNGAVAARRRARARHSRDPVGLTSRGVRRVDAVRIDVQPGIRRLSVMGGLRLRHACTTRADCRRRALYSPDCLDQRQPRHKRRLHRHRRVRGAAGQARTRARPRWAIRSRG